MVSAKMNLATPICALLVFLCPSAATANEDVPEETPASGPPLYVDMSQIILVSSSERWREVRSRLAMWIRRPILTVTMEDEPFSTILKAAFARSDKPLFLGVYAEKKTSTRQLPDIAWFSCSRAYLFRNDFDNDVLARSASLTPRQSACNSGYITMNETSIQNFFWPKEFSADLKSLSKVTFGKVKPLKRCSADGFGGRELTVGCLKVMHHESTENTCDDPSVIAVLAMLNRKNITVKRRQALHLTQLLHELDTYNSDIVLYPTPIHLYAYGLYNFPLTRSVQDTFYSRVDAHRIVSLLEVAGESWKLLAATIALLAVVLFVSVGGGDKDGSISRRISDTTLFLLAPFLATSVHQPNTASRAGVARRALLGLWLAALLPLSVYFRTELTAIVTLRRPAYRVDTLQKLEDALDRRQVAPCIVYNTLSHIEFVLNDSSSVPQQSLLKKLTSEFARHGEEALLTSNLSECIQCASRPDRVCYVGAWRNPSSSLLRHTNVAAFVEHMKTALLGIPMVKSELFYWPLRRFFFDIEEHKLIDWDSKEAAYDNADTEFDVSGLLILLVILHATSCLVLVLEVAVARWMHRRLFNQRV